MHAGLDRGAVRLLTRTGRVNIRPSRRPSHHSRPGGPIRGASIRSTSRGTGLQSTLRWREVDSNRRSRRRTSFSEAPGDRLARWPEPDFDDRRGQVYHVPCRGSIRQRYQRRVPGLGKEASAGPCQPARFRALTRPVPGDSVPRSLICETSRMISRTRPAILSTGSERHADRFS